MEIRQTYWKPEEVKQEYYNQGDPYKLLFSVIKFKEKNQEQSMFGAIIGWNEPKKFWKPFFVIHLRHLIINMGWLI